MNSMVRRISSVAPGTNRLPWGWQNHLLHPEPSHWLAAGLACLLYTGVFLMLGYARFDTRDL